MDRMSEAGEGERRSRSRMDQTGAENSGRGSVSSVYSWNHKHARGDGRA